MARSDKEAWDGYWREGTPRPGVAFWDVRRYDGYRATMRTVKPLSKSLMKYTLASSATTLP